MITWTDDEWYMKQRRTLGITWDELPSIGMNSFEHIIYAYPRGQSLDISSLRAWLNQISLKKTAETDMQAADFSLLQRDTTLTEFFL